ncbi:radical SAM protein [bacterium]|nr:radical SAM protein [bacterium]
MAHLTFLDAVARVPALLLGGRFDFDFDDLPLHARGLSARKRLNLMRCALGPRFALPPMVQIEPTNACNLQCPLCPTGSGMKPRPTGHMAWDTFQTILDELGDTLVGAVLYSWGEPFLHPRMTDMVAACTARNIATVTSTNGHFLQTPEEAEAIVDAGLGALVIAIDGSDQDTYESFRRSGNIHKVIRCATLVEEAKAHRGSPVPYTALRTVVTEANRADLGNIERVARETGVNMFSYKSVCRQFEAGALEAFEPSDPDLARYRYDESGQRQAVPFRCRYPFRQPTIFWDGAVVGCEYDYELETPWGRIGEQPFPAIWRNAQADALRRAIHSGKGRPAFCGRCPYQDRVGKSCVLTSRELRTP